MKVLLYAKEKNRAGYRLQRVIETFDRGHGIEICRTIDDLTRRLRQPRDNLAIAVLLAVSRKELLDLLSIGDLLWDLRIILLLPDREEETISKGHNLRPRFLSYADSDFKDVGAVLGKMLERINNKI